MLLAGDVGGTKTLLGLFEQAHVRPALVASRSYATNSFGGFRDILDAFTRDIQHPFSIDAAAIGVAGPVIARSATLTNVPWRVTSQEIAEHFDTPHAELLNDLEAMSYSVEVLTTDELVVVQDAPADPRGNAAVIAAGTGLGEALLHRVSGRLMPLPSEGGHADFAARSEREVDFARMLRALYGRAAIEQVLSGQGLLNLHRFTHDAEECAAVRGRPAPERPAAISDAALGGRCPRCGEALEMFVSAYGAESGNLALRGMATSGVFLGGGIAPKVLPALRGGGFLHAFLDKPPMSELLSTVPIHVIRSPDAGLLGAAVYAQQHLV